MLKKLNNDSNHKLQPTKQNLNLSKSHTSTRQKIFFKTLIDGCQSDTKAMLIIRLKQKIDKLRKILN